jgi:hypothetical protein
MAECASEVLESLEGLVGAINSRADDIASESATVLAQWHRLGRVGGKRDDHAAELLLGVRRRLDTLANFARLCSERITAVELKPFGDG